MKQKNGIFISCLACLLIVAAVACLWSSGFINELNGISPNNV